MLIPYLSDLFMLGLAFGMLGLVYVWLARPARIVNPYCAVGDRLTFRFSLTENLS